jgi:hypothetical protein
MRPTPQLATSNASASPARARPLEAFSMRDDLIKVPPAFEDDASSKGPPV